LVHLEFILDCTGEMQDGAIESLVALVLVFQLLKQIVSNTHERVGV